VVRKCAKLNMTPAQVESAAAQGHEAKRLRGRRRQGGLEVGAHAGQLQQSVLQQRGQHPRHGHQGYRVRRTRYVLISSSLNSLSRSRFFSN
jgi:hypothetical protein